MTIVPLDGLHGDMVSPAAETVAGAATAPSSFGKDFARALDAAGATLARADVSERAFATGTGGLQEMVLDRAQADVALSIATTAASRATQALSTILGMQI